MDLTEQYYTTSEDDSDDGEQLYDPEDFTTSMSKGTSTTCETVPLQPTESWD